MELVLLSDRSYHIMHSYQRWINSVLKPPFVCNFLPFSIDFTITDLHWCAKIKDEVEKLAYQLNEEAERTERPIRRLSKVMYGSTCADMQVDVMGSV
ncbi:uncharacterized protein TNCV_751371 [Trichonephila clavipes]|uniref:Uncharacterized protein n=1 Tax=Trichonephila clavipes TaxID=2585209 RepID=A0A8X7BI11_TRICX|nr:uncharacterized protein TNCV_751371 [Trichonephila clavipes]